MVISVTIYVTSILLSLVLTVNGTAHLSLVHVDRLIEKERKMVEIYQTFFNTFDENNIEALFSKQTKLLSKLEMAIKNTNSENPINCFHLFERLVNQWPRLFNGTICKNCIQSESRRHLKRKVDQLKYDSIGWPTGSDLKGCAIALLRLQKIYDLNLQDFFLGRILDWKTNPLSPKEILIIVKYALDENMIDHGTKWAEELLVAFDKKETRDPDKYVQTRRKCQDFLTKFHERKEMSRIAHNKVEVQNDMQPIPHSSTEGPSKAIRREVLFDKYERLCKEGQKTYKEMSKLRCVIRNTKNPLYKSKEEILHFQPRVSLFHDVISDHEIHQLERMALDTNLIMSKVHGRSNPKLIHTRVSKTAWIFDDNNKITKTLGRRISTITGLNTEWKYPVTNAELMQVVNYGVGGMYTPHTDFLGSAYLASMEGPPLQGSGDRIATWMFYLNDVRAGGATVFPLLDTRAIPVRGSALFWYNIDIDGEYDLSTIHAGCPVLLGRKWIANKWIRELGQIFTRPCGLRKNTENKIPYDLKYIH